ncbi:hypothetical protein [Clostridium sp.]|uniref:hypothetical protein n=1 Tax=Clostridium sp. TaxID=1506 RepID=UPI00290F6123|nr:hypothetical protein [Clostridium sp.]MDU3410043.1 hypothetical protein [Clostridium sp.]
MKDIKNVEVKEFIQISLGEEKMFLCEEMKVEIITDDTDFKKNIVGVIERTDVNGLEIGYKNNHDKWEKSFIHWDYIEEINVVLNS